MTKEELASENTELKKKLAQYENEQVKSFALTTGIIEVMVDSDLDPKEFMNLLEKYGAFIRHGMLMKLINTVSTEEFQKLDRISACRVGVNCFAAFGSDFVSEFKSALIDK